MNYQIWWSNINFAHRSNGHWNASIPILSLYNEIYIKLLQEKSKKKRMLEFKKSLFFYKKFYIEERKDKFLWDSFFVFLKKKTSSIAPWFSIHLSLINQIFHDLIQANSSWFIQANSSWLFSLWYYFILHTRYHESFPVCETSTWHSSFQMYISHPLSSVFSTTVVSFLISSPLY